MCIRSKHSNSISNNNKITMIMLDDAEITRRVVKILQICAFKGTFYYFEIVIIFWIIPDSVQGVLMAVFTDHSWQTQGNICSDQDRTPKLFACKARALCTIIMLIVHIILVYGKFIDSINIIYNVTFL